MEEELNPDLERLRIEKRRLELDEQKAKVDQRFLNRNFAAVTTLAVGLVGVLLSAAQIWVAYIQKERELVQKDRESITEELAKQRDLDLQEKGTCEVLSSRIIRTFSLRTPPSGTG